MRVPIKNVKGKLIADAYWCGESYAGCDDRSITIEFTDGSTLTFEVSTNESLIGDVVVRRKNETIAHQSDLNRKHFERRKP